MGRFDPRPKVSGARPKGWMAQLLFTVPSGKTRRRGTPPRFHAAELVGQRFSFSAAVSTIPRRPTALRQQAAAFTRFAGQHKAFT